MKKGFTLIEIIIVIVLITLIGTISMVALNKDNDRTFGTALKRAFDAVNVYINIEKDEIGNTFFNGIYKGGEGVIVPISELYNKGYINQSDYKIIIKQLKDDKEYFVAGFKNSDECKSGVTINLANADNLKNTTYICGYKYEVKDSLFSKIKNMEFSTDCSLETSNSLCYLHGEHISDDDNVKDIWYFKGESVNNYLSINGNIYRIVRTVEDNNIKIIDDEVISGKLLSSDHNQYRWYGEEGNDPYYWCDASAYNVDNCVKYECDETLNGWDDDRDITCTYKQYQYSPEYTISIKSPVYTHLYLPLLNKYNEVSSFLEKYIVSDYEWCTGENIIDEKRTISFKCKEENTLIKSNFGILNMFEYRYIQNIIHPEYKKYENYIYNHIQTSSFDICADTKEIMFGFNGSFYNTAHILPDSGWCPREQNTNIRPAYVIKGNSKVIGGDGSSDNPFVIEGLAS